MLAMGVATFFHDLTTPGAWGACMDVGGKFAGTLSGSMNMMGNFGSLAFAHRHGLHPEVTQATTGTCACTAWRPPTCWERSAGR